MYHLTATETFDAAHFLPNYEGKCKNLHGHTWKIEVEVFSEYLDHNDFVIDFSKIKQSIRELDHQLLNDFIPNPTAENIAKYLFQKLPVFHLKKITVWETPDNKVAYFEDPRIVAC